jgi:hypothetical protein
MILLHGLRFSMTPLSSFHPIISTVLSFYHSQPTIPTVPLSVPSYILSSYYSHYPIILLFLRPIILLLPPPHRPVISAVLSSCYFCRPVILLLPPPHHPIISASYHPITPTTPYYFCHPIILIPVVPLFASSHL